LILANEKKFASGQNFIGDFVLLERMQIEIFEILQKFANECSINGILKNVISL